MAVLDSAVSIKYTIHNQISETDSCESLVLILIVRVRFMVFDTTFNNIPVISWRSVLLKEETGVPGENHRPSACH
jgi:hypothetical protein